MSDGGYVYAILAANGLVKIGFSTNPRSRVVKINSDASSPCRLVGAIEASAKTEEEIHKRLAPYRVYSEWYRYEGEVRALVSQMPPMPPKTWKDRKPWTRQKVPDLIQKINEVPGPDPKVPFSLDSLGTGKAFVCGLEADNGLLSLKVSLRAAALIPSILRISPIPIRLLFAIKGSIKHRTLLSELFAPWKAHGDWFRAEGGVKEFFDAHRGEGQVRVLEWQDVLLPVSDPEADKSSKLASLEKRKASMRAAWADPTRKARWLQDIRNGWVNSQPEKSIREIVVPVWVPPGLANIYLNLSEKHGEEFAASEVRRLKNRALDRRVAAE